MAKQEAKRLSERVIAGMRKAAAKGTKSGNPIGRPRVDAETERAIQRLLRGGTGINKTAATVGVGTEPFSGSGLKWALSKAGPRRDAAVSSLTTRHRAIGRPGGSNLGRGSFAGSDWAT